jgi:uncharacterized protein (TIGR02444 family)
VGDSEFWQFSLGFYAAAGVAPACIELQDRAGVDVNVLLYLLFLAGHGRSVDDATLVRIEAVAADWRNEVVVPLRALRRGLKMPIGPVPTETSAGLRSDVQRIELAAERIEQETLERLVPRESLPSAAPGPSLARENLAAYERVAGELALQPLERILQAFAAHLAAGRS